MNRSIAGCLTMWAMWALRMGMFAVMTVGSEGIINAQTANAPQALPNSMPASPLNSAAPSANNGIPNVPSLDQAAPLSRPRSSSNVNQQLPHDAGQYWDEYDLKPYTQNLKSVDRPEQAIVDWILRQTGTDVWFSQPSGFMEPSRTSLRVYHTDAMHQVVRLIHERFVNGTVEPQVFGLRIISIGNPNWRTRGLSLMKSVQVQSPGVHAWLLSKENNALLMAMLRGRSDFREIHSADLVIYNGQSQAIEQLRSRNYVREYQKADQPWSPYLPVTAEIQEGYRLLFSPLMSIDRETVDVVLKCNIDQVEQLKNVTIDLPYPNGQFQPVQINVPQVASWRLHERFQWPANQVLLLSCGVIAAPAGTANNTLLGQGSGLLGLDRLVPGAAAGDRADALLMIEHKGNASTHLLTAPTPNSASSSASPSISRGRY